jgi:LPS sulfotransferase NodH
MNVRSIALHQLARPSPRVRVRGVTKAQTGRRTSPAVTYIIYTNPRSGSWLLCEGLSSTSLAGYPREWFNILEERLHRARWCMDHSTDLSYPVYPDILRSKSTSRNGISGIKLHYYQFAHLPRRMEGIKCFNGLTAAQIIAKLFPSVKYAWLKRRDKVRQAISLLIASRTNEWWNFEGAAPGKNEGGATDIEFNPQGIARRQQALIANDAKWQSYFAESQLDPQVIDYEDLVANYADTVTSVLTWLGVPNAVGVPIPPSRLKRQADARNEEWLARYEAFKSDHAALSLAAHESDGSLPRTASPSGGCYASGLNARSRKSNGRGFLGHRRAGPSNDEDRTSSLLPAQ